MRRQRLGIAALASDAAFYGSVRAVLKSLAFLLVPLYAHFLAPTEFGRLELVLATVALVDVLITAGMDGVFARFYFDRDDPDWRRRIITLYLVIETVYPALVVFPLVIFSAQPLRPGLRRRDLRGVLRDRARRHLPHEHRRPPDEPHAAPAQAAPVRRSTR